MSPARNHLQEVPVRVFFSADVDEARLPALDELARSGHLTMAEAAGVPLLLRPAPDSQLLAAAEPMLQRWLARPYPGGQAYREHVIYWLRVAADIAHRSGS